MVAFADMVQASQVQSPPEATVAPPQRLLVPSPLGILGLELHGETVTRLVFAPTAKQKREFIPLKEVDRSDFLDEVVGRFSEYFAGARRDLRLEFDLSHAGLDELTTKILLQCTQIPYGQTRTYQQLAAAAGESGAYRLVRAALVANPIPILVPCHRVTPAKGGPGTFVGGTKRKAWLLKLEARVVAER